MPSDLSLLLRNAVDRELPHLRQFSAESASIKPVGAESWSPKQELGHLIDSAANNHIRFVRAALEPELVGLSYAQNDWVDIHAYQDMSWDAIVDFWAQYNGFIADLLNHIPEDKLRTNCIIGKGDGVTLRFLIEDYVLHMQHHIDHLLQRPVVTAYPAPQTAPNQNKPAVL